MNIQRQPQLSIELSLIVGKIWWKRLQANGIPQKSEVYSGSLNNSDAIGTALACVWHEPHIGPILANCPNKKIYTTLSVGSSISTSKWLLVEKKKKKKSVANMTISPQTWSTLRFSPWQSFCISGTASITHSAKKILSLTVYHQDDRWRSLHMLFPAYIRDPPKLSHDSLSILIISYAWHCQHHHADPWIIYCVAPYICPVFTEYSRTPFLAASKYFNLASSELLFFRQLVHANRSKHQGQLLYSRMSW